MKDNLLSKLGFGTVALTSFAFESSAIRFLNQIADAGIKYFDTAPIYGSGYAEKILGSFIKGKKRENLIIATKFGLGLPSPKIPVRLAMPLNALKKKLTNAQPHKSSKPNIPRVFEPRIISVQSIQESLETSLKNLNTDYIDNYFLHEAVPSFLADDAFAFLIEKKKEGVVKKIGIACNYINIQSLNKDEINDWDILQYENGIFYPTDPILKQFPDQQHIYHSVLRGLNTKNGLKAGNVLIECLTKNPNGITLFSTSNHHNLQDNLNMIRDYTLKNNSI